VSKLVTMKEAMSRLVHDGDTVAMEGFTHLIPFAAAHELMRQRRRNLTLVRLTPDLIFDQMVAAGCARKLIFSWAGNPGVGPLHAVRRALEQQQPAALEFEEYSHFGLVLRFQAAAANVPFLPTRNFAGSDLGVSTNISPSPARTQAKSSDGASAVRCCHPARPAPMTKATVVGTSRRTSCVRRPPRGGDR
jgi:glutaconate CoA-transferase subunit A